MKTLQRLIFACVLVTLLVPSTASAADSRKDIEQRLEQRYPQVLAAKRQGALGETWQGLVDAVDLSKASAEIKTLIEQENTDRRALYEIIAAETSREGSKVSATQVGERNGQRNFRRAGSSEYFKTREGVWIQAGDLAKFISDGKIGETWQGTVEAVSGSTDSRVAAVVAQENRGRAEQYAIEARKQGKTAQQVAEQAGQKNIASAKSGTYVKERDGTWKRK